MLGHEEFFLNGGLSHGLVLSHKECTVSKHLNDGLSLSGVGGGLQEVYLNHSTIVSLIRGWCWVTKNLLKHLNDGLTQGSVLGHKEFILTSQRWSLSWVDAWSQGIDLNISTTVSLMGWCLVRKQSLFKDLNYGIS